jgi:hypothetical protein
LVLFYTITYTGITISASYLGVFYIKQTLNEFITNFYYLIGCIIYQLYLFVSTLFISNQRGSVALNTQPLNYVSVPKSLQINTPLTDSTSVNPNLFFLQKSLLALNNVSNSATTLTPNLNSNDTLSVSNSFMGKVNFLSTISNNTSYNNANSVINIETPYILSTGLNSNFSNSLTLSTTLGNLYTDEGSFQSDPILTESLTHNLNNIAKQQR